MAAIKRESIIGIIGVCLGIGGTIFATGQAMAPVKTMPEELKELHKSVRVLEVTMGKLEVTMSALTESIRDSRILRNEFNAFRLETAAQMGAMKADIDRLKAAGK